MPEKTILLGVIGRPHGVRGHVHVHSYTSHPADLAAYGLLSDGSGRQFRLRWQSEGVARIAEIVAGKPVWISDREAAGRLVNIQLFIDRDRLPPPAEDEFYLADLVGLAAVRPDGAALGRVDAVHDYGAGASLEIGSLLIPFTRATVPEVDIASGRVVVLPPEETAGEAAP